MNEGKETIDEIFKKKHLVCQEQQTQKGKKRQVRALDINNGDST